MTLDQAVQKLGGPSAAAKATAIPRTTILYWLQEGIEPPEWRKADVGKIIAAAKARKVERCRT